MTKDAGIRARDKAQITPEMIDAGIAYLVSMGADILSTRLTEPDFVAGFYQAMARPTASKPASADCDQSDLLRRSPHR